MELISFDNSLDKGKTILSDQRAKKMELYAGAEDGYLDTDMETQTDSLDNLPLALSHPTTELHRPGKLSRPTTKLASGGE